MKRNGEISGRMFSEAFRPNSKSKSDGKTKTKQSTNTIELIVFFIRCAIGLCRFASLSLIRESFKFDFKVDFYLVINHICLKTNATATTTKKQPKTKRHF